MSKGLKTCPHCGRQVLRLVIGLCGTCYHYQHRTGQVRPPELCAVPPRETYEAACVNCGLVTSRRWGGRCSPCYRHWWRKGVDRRPPPPPVSPSGSPADPASGGYPVPALEGAIHWSDERSQAVVLTDHPGGMIARLRAREAHLGGARRVFFLPRLVRLEAIAKAFALPEDT